MDNKYARLTVIDPVNCLEGKPYCQQYYVVLHVCHMTTLIGFQSHEHYPLMIKGDKEIDLVT